MKKIMLGLSLVFLAVFARSQGLKNVIVEKYYVSNAADATAADADADNSGAAHGALPVGSVTYRVYADLLPGYKFQAIYGVPNHEFSVATTTSFYNNSAGGTQPAWSKTAAKNNVLALDSWFSAGAAANGNFGILKTEDNGVANNVTTANNPDGVLLNADAAAGIPLTTQDGLIAGSIQTVTFVGFTNELDVFGDGTVVGNTFTTTNGSVASLNGSTSPATSTKVLIGQFTTAGALSFALNIQIGTPSGGVENYVAKNPVDAEILMPSLTYPTTTINKLPVVKITAPANNSIAVTGATVAIAATATDSDGTVAKVEFFVNGTKIGESATAPYQINWTAVKGTSTLTAVATDDKGGKTTSAVVTVIVNDPVNKRPVVAITTPANNSTFTTGATVAIAATATDSDGTVALVEFFVNGTKIGEDATSPYQINWTAVKGTSTLTAIATDDKGGKTTSAVVTVIVNDAANKLPVVKITTPANNSTFTTGATVAIAATATDSDGTVAKVEFFVNGTKIGESATAPYQINWTAVKGTSTLTAVATDDKGGKTTSAVVTVIVNDAANKLPVVKITTPANNSTFTTGATVAIAATATDSDGTVAKVEFFVNGTKIGESATAPYQINWTAVKGTSTLTAVATDDKGGKTTSAVVTVIVNDAANKLPVVKITTPANNSTFTTGATVAIAATATDSDGTVAKVEFFVNGTKIGESATAPYQINWTAVKGTSTLTAVATDDKGGKTTSAVVTVIVNDAANKLPVVKITTPANNSTFTTGATVAIAATATDSDGTVAKVEFFVNGTKIGESATAPYQINWTAVKGISTLTAVATDDKGGKTTSAVVTVIVNDAANKLPVVKITTPANNSTFTTGATVAIAATATDSDGTVAKVEFFVNGVKIGEDATSPYQINWTAVKGTSTLTAVATDDKGGKTTSAVVTVIVNDAANKLPVVKITTPANNSTFTTGATVAIAATATDSDGTVAKVEFFVNGVKIGEDATSPYQINWTAVKGTSTLTAVATDDKGGKTTSAVVTVIVNDAANKLPVVKITTPANNSTFTTGATVAIAATATDSDGTVAKVEFFVNGVKIGEDATSPYQINWTAVKGTSTLTAVATDDKGGKTTSAVVTVIVNDAANKLPVVKITTPANNATFITGATVAIAATATDSDGTVAKVEFFVNGVKIGEDATSPYQINWTAVKGTSTLTAVATDDKGGKTTSAVVTVIVNDAANKLPVVKITTPANNATFITGATVAIAATATDSDGTVAKVEFFVNGVKIGEDATSPYQINWTAVKGTSTLTAVATDDKDGKTTSAVVTVIVNDAANKIPVVKITAPANGATYTTGATVAIAATATDSDGTIVKVEFFVNGTKVGEDATAPYQFNWTSVAGTATLTAVATDNKGAKGTSPAVTIIVTNPNNCANSHLAVNAGPDQVVKLGYAPKQFATLTAHATGGTPAYNYTWSTSQTTASIIVAPTTSTTYTVTVKDAKGCTATDNVYVSVQDVRCGNDGVQICWTFKIQGIVLARQTFCVTQDIAYLLVNFFNTSTSTWSIGSCNSPQYDSSALGKEDLAGSDFGSQENLTAEEYALIYGTPAINIYPNPASNLALINLELKNVVGENVQVTVQDILGKVILNEKVAVNDHAVNTQLNFGSNLPKGTYIVRVTTGSTVATKKLIVQ